MGLYCKSEASKAKSCDVYMFEWMFFQSVTNSGHIVSITDGQLSTTYVHDTYLTTPENCDFRESNSRNGNQVPLGPLQRYSVVIERWKFFLDSRKVTDGEDEHENKHYFDAREKRPNATDIWTGVCSNSFHPRASILACPSVHYGSCIGRAFTGGTALSPIQFELCTTTPSHIIHSSHLFRLFLRTTHEYTQGVPVLLLAHIGAMSHLGSDSALFPHKIVLRTEYGENSSLDASEFDGVKI